MKSGSSLLAMGQVVLLQDFFFVVGPVECQLPVDAGDGGVEACEGRVFDIVAVGEFPGGRGGCR